MSHHDKSSASGNANGTSPDNPLAAVSQQVQATSDTLLTLWAQQLQALQTQTAALDEAIAAAQSARQALHDQQAALQADIAHWQAENARAGGSLQARLAEFEAALTNRATHASDAALHQLTQAIDHAHAIRDQLQTEFETSLQATLDTALHETVQHQLQDALNDPLQETLDDTLTTALDDFRQQMQTALQDLIQDMIDDEWQAILDDADTPSLETMLKAAIDKQVAQRLEAHETAVNTPLEAMDGRVTTLAGDVQMLADALQSQQTRLDALHDDVYGAAPPQQVRDQLQTQQHDLQTLQRAIQQVQTQFEQHIESAFGADGIIDTLRDTLRHQQQHAHQQQTDAHDTLQRRVRRLEDQTSREHEMVKQDVAGVERKVDRLTKDLRSAWQAYIWWLAQEARTAPDSDVVALVDVTGRAMVQCPEPIFYLELYMTWQDAMNTLLERAKRRKERDAADDWLQRAATRYGA